MLILHGLAFIAIVNHGVQFNVVFGPRLVVGLLFGVWVEGEGGRTVNGPAHQWYNQAAPSTVGQKRRTIPTYLVSQQLWTKVITPICFVSTKGKG